MSLQVFKNSQFGEIRTIIDDKSGDLLFCGSDVAKALGYTNAPDALARHCRAIVKRDTPISGKIQEVNFIPEGDVHRLIAHSRLPAAKQYESWIFDELLPTIRKTGKYESKPKAEQLRLEDGEVKVKHSSGVPVLTCRDLERLTGIPAARISARMKAKLFREGTDYWVLRGERMAQFRSENPGVTNAPYLMVITEKGCRKLFNSISQDTAALTCFAPTVYSEQPHKKLGYGVKTVSDMGGDPKIREKIQKVRNLMISVDNLLDMYTMYLAPEDHSGVATTLRITSNKLYMTALELTDQKLRTSEQII